MKRLSAFLLFAFLAVLVLAIPAPAADLQAGWYAKVPTVSIWQYDDQGRLFLRADGYFYDTPPGQYGPFLVTDGPYHASYWREAHVPTNAYGVGPTASLIMPLSFGMTIGEPIAPWACHGRPIMIQYKCISSSGVPGPTVNRSLYGSSPLADVNMVQRQYCMIPS